MFFVPYILLEVPCNLLLGDAGVHTSFRDEEHKEGPSEENSAVHFYQHRHGILGCRDSLSRSYTVLRRPRGLSSHHRGARGRFFSRLSLPDLDVSKCS